MTRYITPIILILVSIVAFFLLTNPIYQQIYSDVYNGEPGLNAQVKSYNDALDNSKTLESERDNLIAESDAMNPMDVTNLKKLLPENVDNIRLILEIGELAKPYGMVFKDVKYDVNETTTSDTGGATVVQGGGVVNSTPLDYGIFDLEFSTSGTYNNFISFTKALESNLRIVDISSVVFSSGNIAVTGAASGVSPITNSPEIYKYDFKIKTYWLKN